MVEPFFIEAAIGGGGMTAVVGLMIKHITNRRVHKDPNGDPHTQLAVNNAITECRKYHNERDRDIEMTLTRIEEAVEWIKKRQEG